MEITPFRMNDFLSTLSDKFRNSSRAIVAGHNLHSVYLYHSNHSMRVFYESASLVLPDGMPVQIDYRLSGGRIKSERIGSTDWLLHLDRVEHLSRLLIIGAGAKANSRTVDRMKKLLPHCIVRGIPGDQWDSEKERQAIQAYEDFQPNLTLLGLGMPLQESVALRLQELPSGGTIATVGGAIDQLAGEQRNSPRWLGRLGLEWLWRLITQPSRLAHRYLVEPWKLLSLRLKMLTRQGH
ncbi:WecB/TagA/CpsF family glycosyltransferase [Gulosibacter chungangensis]|uniref:WecB/TagA/CpsF family glycosyltransferase n=1 Tax=Gulosibacter chungangensis TaxID=979746 RepID=A0A7J5BA60_9MICO|nr:WecB/TagA/CpsF family glycosyltransferase [Gulosibacter chungangensis]KAB1641002.1 WecB/TagA/CpsF family glycosyltransferase [Gulosibacter chungangensis]